MPSNYHYNTQVVSLSGTAIKVVATHSTTKQKRARNYFCSQSSKPAARHSFGAARPACATVLAALHRLGVCNPEVCPITAVLKISEALPIAHCGQLGKFSVRAGACTVMEVIDKAGLFANLPPRVNAGHARFIGLHR
jgi:hypothetical protein